MRDKFKDLPISNSITSCYCESKMRIDAIFISDIAKPFSVPTFDKSPSHLGDFDPMDLWYKAHGLKSMWE